MAQPPTARSNAQWLADLRADGPRGAAAQEELRRHLAAAVRKVAKDESLLEDLTQVALLRVLEVLDRFEGKSRFTTWAWSVGTRAALTELRKPGYRAEAATEPPPDRADSAAGPGESASRQEIVARMMRVIEEELTDRQRTALLGELGGTPQDELLTTLGLQRNALYKLLHDARRKLRAGLASAGICDDQVRDAFDL